LETVQNNKKLTFRYRRNTHKQKTYQVANVTKQKKLSGALSSQYVRPTLSLEKIFTVFSLQLGKLKYFNMRRRKFNRRFQNKLLQKAP
jgi:hypothetical protein